MTQSSQQELFRPVRSVVSDGKENELPIISRSQLPQIKLNSLLFVPYLPILT